jgi:hypothetical protein
VQKVKDLRGRYISLEETVGDLVSALAAVLSKVKEEEVEIKAEGKGVRMKGAGKQVDVKAEGEQAGLDAARKRARESIPGQD